MKKTLFLGSNISLFEYYKSIKDSPLQIFLSVVDILLVIYLIYKTFKLAKGKRTLQILKGIFLLIILNILSSVLNLYIINTILTSLTTYGIIALVVIFQPEIRRVLQDLSMSKMAKAFGLYTQKINNTKEDIYKIVIAAENFSKNKIGALIVMESEISLKDIIDTGVQIDSVVSVPLLQNIFIPNTPLHDGAVVIADNKIRSASSILPLSDKKNLPKSFGTRHRAALGLSEETDALIVVVSEETGKISLAKEGELIVNLTPEALKKIMIDSLIKDKEKKKEEKAEKIEDKRTFEDKQE